MKKSIILLLSLSLIFSLSACGDSFKQGMKDGMQGTTQESAVASEEETTLEEDSEIEAEQEETAKRAEVALEESESIEEPNIEENLVYEYDDLQNLFIELNVNITPDELERCIEKYSLEHTVGEYNSSSGKEIMYCIAYTEGAAAQKYADSGDRLEVTFGGENKDEFMYAEYVNENDISYTALLYDHGIYWDFSEGNAEDYSGYYINDSFSSKTGIVVKYDNGRESKTNYFRYNSAEEVIQKIIDKIKED